MKRSLSHHGWLGRPGFHPARCAFTLLELLVGVGIVVVILALAFPALTSASRASKQAACAANMRAVASMVMLLIAEEGKLPTPGKKPDGGDEESNYVKWLKDRKYLDRELRCPFIGKAEEGKNVFKYGLSENVYNYYPEVKKIPAPPSLVPIMMESYFIYSYAQVHLFMTMWGAPAGLGSNPTLEVLQAKEESARRAQYHGGRGKDRGMYMFFLDGHLALYRPTFKDGRFYTDDIVYTSSEFARMKRNGTY